jgi:multidrug efflux pump subunit AcrB
VTVARTTIGGGAPKLMLDVDEARARLLGLDLAQLARQLETGLEGVTGGSLLEGTEELPVRVRFGAGLRSDPTAIVGMPILPPAAAALSAAGQFPGIALSALGTLRLVPAESAVTRRNGERLNTVQGFLTPGVLPEEALGTFLRNLDAEGFRLPEGVRMETGGDADARASTVQALPALLGLIVVLAIATVVLTFDPFRLTLIAFVAAGLSAGLSLLTLAVFNYPFGINAIIGLIVLSTLQQDDAAAVGDRDAMAEVVVDASRRILSKAVATFGGFLPSIPGDGGFWPPFAMAIAGGVLLSPLLAFWSAPAMFTLLRWRRVAAPAIPAVDDAGGRVAAARAA